MIKRAKKIKYFERKDLVPTEEDKIMKTAVLKNLIKAVMTIGISKKLEINIYNEKENAKEKEESEQKNKIKRKLWKFAFKNRQVESANPGMISHNADLPDIMQPNCRG